MLPKLLTSIFGSRNERLLKEYRRTVAKINALEPSLEPLSDDQLRAMVRDELVRAHRSRALTPERPVIRSLEEELARVVRARAVNPKWILPLRRSKPLPAWLPRPAPRWAGS